MKDLIFRKSAAHTDSFDSKEEKLLNGKLISPAQADSLEFKQYLKEQVLHEYLNYYSVQTMEKKKFFLPRRFWLVGAAMAVVLAVTVSAILLVPSIKKLNKGSLGAEIAYTQGEIEYKSAKEENWKKVSSDTALAQGDSVRITGEGRAIINLDDGSSIRLNNASQATLTSMDPNHIVISNDKGEVYTRVVKADRAFEVVAANVTYQSHGTAYKTINTDTEKGVEVYQSEVEILGVNEATQILVKQGESYFVVNTAEPDLAKKVTPVSIDAISKDDFVMWNKDQDEKVTEFKGQMGVLFDVVPPVLTVESPKEAEHTTADKITVKGTTEAEVTITINDQAVANNAGSFSYDFALNMGANGIKVISEDKSGNKTVVNLNVVRDPVATPTPVSTPAPQKASIKLTGTKVNEGVSLTWNVTAVDTAHGFKVVRSTSANPVYPGNDYQYLSNGSQRNYTWGITDGVTYHFRVCQYLDNGKCGVYSNDITVSAPGSSQSGGVSSISVTADDAANTVSWTVSGVSDLGFKVVWSKTSNPVYPNRGTDRYQYFSSADQRSSDLLDTFDGPGSYYVRVCEYLGGSCGKYSNQVTINLE